MTQSLAHLAAEVALSQSRLHRLAQDAFAIPLVQFRAWTRLRNAMFILDHRSPAIAAADADFADQAHLTRTARRLLGRTPGLVASALRSNRPVRAPGPVITGPRRAATSTAAAVTTAQTKREAAAR